MYLIISNMDLFVSTGKEEDVEYVEEMETKKTSVNFMQTYD